MKKKVIDPIGTLIGFLLFAGAMSIFATEYFDDKDLKVWAELK